MESVSCHTNTSAETAGGSLSSSTTSSQNAEYQDEDSCNTTEFYFESDHLALKGNGDYLTLLKTIAVLESQRVKAVQVRQP
jgi:hypothetical protein